MGGWLTTSSSISRIGCRIGRVTEGLLLDGIAQQVDVIEPIAKFTAVLEGKPGVRNIFSMGLEDWQPSEHIRYDLIWIQWCVGQLTDEQLVRFLERCQTALDPDTGVIVVKDNNSTSGEDVFDEVDSSVTRCVWPFLASSAATSDADVPGETARFGGSLPKQACGSSNLSSRKASAHTCYPSGCTH